ncbi:hypothetical protein ABIF97_004082 [Bradyrhizobium japonicum]
METFKLSSDPHFAAKVRDVVGLYVSPPGHAVVLCVDEKSQIQTPNRSQPIAADAPRPSGATNKKWHGTTSLFAALDIATGRVIGKWYERHRAAEFCKFLDEIEPSVPSGLDVHPAMDNYATAADPKMAGKAAALARALDPGQFRHGSTKSSASSRLTDKKISEASIAAWWPSGRTSPRSSNDTTDPKPFRWPKSADNIFSSIERIRLVMLRRTRRDDFWRVFLPWRHPLQRRNLTSWRVRSSQNEVQFLKAHRALFMSSVPSRPVGRSTERGRSEIPRAGLARAAENLSGRPRLRPPALVHEQHRFTTSRAKPSSCVTTTMVSPLRASSRMTPTSFSASKEVWLAKQHQR